MFRNIFYRLFCLVLLIAFVINPIAVNAEEVEGNQEGKVTLEDYGKLGLWFIGTDIYTNPDSSWSEKTRIKAIVPVKNFADDVIGYTFELKTQNQDSGYMFVKYSNDELVIAEYSYSGAPLYTVPKISGKVRDVYVNEQAEYFVLSNSNKLYDLDGNLLDRNLIKPKKPSKKVLNNDLNKQLKNFETTLEEWMVGYNGQVSGAAGTNAGIENTYQYVIDRYGSGWIYTTNKILPVSAYLQSGFNSALGLNDNDNCVISSVVTILKYYQTNKGYSSIPNNIYTIYQDVRKIAISYGYDPIGGGTWPTKINNIVSDSFAKYGYSVTGNTDYIISYAEFVNQIDNNRPLLFSNVSGYYANHTFVVKGYRGYTKSTASKNFLSVNDNWTTAERWYDYSAFNCCGSITRMSK